jgi:hypothetical protein
MLFSRNNKIHTSTVNRINWKEVYNSPSTTNHYAYHMWRWFGNNKLWISTSHNIHLKHSMLQGRHTSTTAVIHENFIRSQNIVNRKSRQYADKTLNEYLGKIKYDRSFITTYNFTCCYFHRTFTPLVHFFLRFVICQHTIVKNKPSGLPPWNKQTN